MKEFLSNDFKSVNLPVKIVGYCVDISKDFIKELNLEYDSTYSFIVSYETTVLSFKGVPYNPIKLTIKDVKEGPVHIKSSIFYSYKLPSFMNDGTTSCGLPGKAVKYEEILHTCIWGLVSRSDIVKGIIENRKFKISEKNTSIFPGEGPTFIYPGVPGYDVINMSLACSKSTKDDLSIVKSNVITIAGN